MQALGCLFLVLFGIFFFIISAAKSIYDAVFGSRMGNTRTPQNNTAKSNSTQQSKHRKVFDDNEGEYVDYVEVKE